MMLAMIKMWKKTEKMKYQNAQILTKPFKGRQKQYQVDSKCQDNVIMSVSRTAGGEEKFSYRKPNQGQGKNSAVRADDKATAANPLGTLRNHVNNILERWKMRQLAQNFCLGLVEFRNIKC